MITEYDLMVSVGLLTLAILATQFRISRLKTEFKDKLKAQHDSNTKIFGNHYSIISTIRKQLDAIPADMNKLVESRTHDLQNFSELVRVLKEHAVKLSAHDSQLDTITRCLSEINDRFNELRQLDALVAAEKLPSDSISFSGYTNVVDRYEGCRISVDYQQRISLLSGPTRLSDSLKRDMLQFEDLIEGTRPVTQGVYTADIERRSAKPNVPQEQTILVLTNVEKTTL